MLAEAGEYEEALKCYDKALELDPGQGAMAWSDKAYALCNLNRYEEALRAVGKATKLDPQNAGLWNNKGLVLEALGRNRRGQRML